mgnify:CR=1 FL=1
MSKTIKYGKNGALVGGLSFIIYNAISQLVKMKEDHTIKFDWGELLTQGVKGTVLGAGAGAAIGGIKDINNSFEEPENTSSVLHIAISNMRLNKSDRTYKSLSEKAEKITYCIDCHYSEKLAGSIVRIGSTEENTALADDFDIDISVPFNPNSFRSTEQMFDDLYYHLKYNFYDPDLIEVRTQRKSVGLIFNLNGEKYKIDVVPYKISAKKGNKTSGYLFVNNNSAFQKDSFTKTDINKLKGIILSPIQQKILVAIKSWKLNFNVPISSHLVKLLILDAYEVNRGKIPQDFTKKLLTIVRHIRDEINFKKIVSVENTNNVLTDISESKKAKITKACDRVLDEYDYQPNSILHFFS